MGLGALSHRGRHVLQQGRHVPQRLVQVRVRHEHLHNLGVLLEDVRQLRQHSLELDAPPVGGHFDRLVRCAFFGVLVLRVQGLHEVLELLLRR